MKVEDCTKTVDGTPVRIYATDGGGVYPVHGAVFSEVDNRWIQERWTPKGRKYADGESRHDLDLTDWEEKIPWSLIKGDWVARWGGIWWAHSLEPSPLSHMHNIHGGEGLSLEGVKMPDGPDELRDAIAKRPEGE